MIHHRTSYTTLNASLHRASTTTITKPPQPPAAGTPTTVYQVAGFQQVARLRTNGLVDYRLYPSPASPFSIVLSSFSSIRISTPPPTYQAQTQRAENAGLKTDARDPPFKISIVSRRCSRKSWFSLFDARARAQTHVHTSTLPLARCHFIFVLLVPSRGRRAVRNSYSFGWLLTLSHYPYPIASISPSRFYSWL